MFTCLRRLFAHTHLRGKDLEPVKSGLVIKWCLPHTRLCAMSYEKFEMQTMLVELSLKTLGLREGIWPPQAFFTVSMILADLHPDKINK